MKIPAIRAQIGIWIYYVATLTFSQINEYVKKIDDELHKSIVLREMLQRSITENYKSIAKYIEQQEERFFNSLVLAVYDGDPQWHEIRLDYDNGEEYYDIGLLELTGDEKIFPVDGQHRVEGIKQVLKKDQKYLNEKVPVILIGHKKDEEGMRRARRLFSTLNRYAKPVSMRDIISLDEDDAIAIISRDLIENNVLFEDERILDAKTKAIPDNNKTAFTSIITFYECNKEILGYYLKDKTVYNENGKKTQGRTKLKYYVKFRPDDNDLNEYKNICEKFWQDFSLNIDDVHSYITNPPNCEQFRNKNGGNILFRPAALIPFVKAIVEIMLRTGEDTKTIFKKINNIPLQLSDDPWKGILWDSNNNKMIMNNGAVIKLLILYLYDQSLLNDEEKNKIVKKYAEAKQITQTAAKNFIDNLSGSEL